MRRIAAMAGLVMLGLAGSGQAPTTVRNPMVLETPCAPAGYGRLLHRYLRVIPLPGGGHETRFDYPAFRSDPDQAKIREDLRGRFLAIDPRTLDSASRRAWAVNAYNFLVLDTVTEHLVAADGETLRSIADLGSEPFAVFDDSVYAAGGDRFSLNGLEREFLFGGEDAGAGKRGRSVDPRFHFAVVCAAKGCPPLEEHAYDPARLDVQLDAAVRNALLLPRNLLLRGDTVHVSKLFEWYAGDFDPEGVRAFLIRYAPPDVSAGLSAAKNAPEIAADIEWDWTLNRP